MPVIFDFPSLVKEIRTVRGLTQEQLARELDVTFSTVNCWENGKHRPIRALASALLRMAQDVGITPQATSRSPTQLETRPKPGRR
jgi:putative transcriptional regulator